MSDKNPVKAAVVVLGVLACLHAATSWCREESRLVLYPAPKGENLSKEWSVEVNGRAVDVYTARVNDPPFEKYDFGGAYSFASFDFRGTATVRVRDLTGRSLENVQILPASKGIRSKRVNESACEFTLDKPCQLSVEPQGRKRPLLIFANPIEENPPRPGDKNVIYFSPGLHKPEGGKIKVGDNQTLYLASGAVVEGGLEVRGENITIRGRGILCGNRWPWRKGPTSTMIDMLGCRNVAIEGIVCRGSSHWTIVPKNCDNVSITNVKICGGRVQNDDGINPCNSRYVRIRDCFIRSDDDCVAAKGLVADWGNVDDVRVERSVLWCDRARITLLGHESRAPHMRNLLYRDLDIIHFTMTAFLLEPGEEMILENVVFEDIRINGEGQRSLAVIQPTINQYMRTKVPGHIRNITFKNIAVSGQPGPYRVAVNGRDAQHKTENVTFENVTILGQPLAQGQANVIIGDHSNNVGFKP
ncbi:hypothetical protein FJY63_04160 [Candidatus Sumerlaeota bacterium]|nr:hypothetical protein [Candidatus Sumerlaeota bacterium]